MPNVNPARASAAPTQTPPSDADSSPADLKVRELPLEALCPWQDNPRTISPQRLEDLKRSLLADKEMLAARPLIALPDGTVICGNQRLLAARELGWKSIQVVTVDLDRERAALRAMRDNATYGEWDEPRLAELLDELRAGGVDLALTGFTGGDLDRILSEIQPELDPDEAPAVPDAADSAIGEIYKLGAHRLACGDARDSRLMERLLGEVQPEVLWTDPPYGVGYTGKTVRRLTIRNDDASAGSVLLEVLQVLDPMLAPAARFYIAAPAGPQGTVFRHAVVEVGWHFHESLVWVKNSLVMGHSDYHLAHEDVLYGYRPGSGRPGRGRHRGSRWYGSNSCSSVFMVDRPARSDVHPTMKPVALIEPMLLNSSRRGDAVIDPFAGSGSTLIACERAGRRCFAVELDPGYCDVIRRRYEEYRNGR